MTMKEKRLSFITLLSALILLFAPFSSAFAADNIVIGCPLSTAFLYGWDAERGVKLAVDEINAQGGVNVGGKKRP
jgi:branched-chain amino acid transport system substrate-binding protein